MSFIELVEIVAKKVKIPKATVAAVLRGFIKESIEELKAGERIKLAGFGTFYLCELNPRAAFGKHLEKRSSIRFKESRRGKVRRGA